eukprot:COSAG02_NODE_5757_length_4062_cov_12.533687_3_plen_59_part_00
MIGANGSVRGQKEFEPSSLAAESEPLLGEERKRSCIAGVPTLLILKKRFPIYQLSRRT